MQFHRKVQHYRVLRFNVKQHFRTGMRVLSEGFDEPFKQNYKVEIGQQQNRFERIISVNLGFTSK